MPILEVSNLKKTYRARAGGSEVTALSDVSFSVEAGEFVAIMGESGSGKTTLLNLIASLDQPTGGQVVLSGQELTRMSDKELAGFRRQKLGFVFQDFNLLDTFSLRDNIFLPLVLSGVPYAQMNARLLPLARRLGIEDLLEKFPYEVSGGQKQRAAVARALITDPAMLLADEPTGALDSKAAQKLMQVFYDLHVSGQTLLMVTHSVRAACFASRVLFIRDGQVHNQIYRGDMSNEVLYTRIADALAALSGGEGA